MTRLFADMRFGRGDARHRRQETGTDTELERLVIVTVEVHAHTIYTELSYSSTCDDSREHRTRLASGRLFPRFDHASWSVGGRELAPAARRSCALSLRS